MTMNTSSRSPSFSFVESESDIETSSPTTSIEYTSNMELNEAGQTRSNNRPKRSDSSISTSYIVEYGPVHVRHRRTASQTLATGRRSKDEPAAGEDAAKREIRRAKNRVAARALKKARDQIEIDLLEKIKTLEQETDSLHMEHKQLEERKAQLNRAVYNAKQAPLVPLITDIDISSLLKFQNQYNLLIDLRSLLENIDIE